MPPIGRIVAPARFLLFILVLSAATPAATHLVGDGWRGFMIGFDLAAATFLISCLPLTRVTDPAVMQDHARRDDANRTILLVLTAIVMAVVLATVGAETMREDAIGVGTKMLVIATLLLAWTFANVTYALHYAHLHYLGGGGIVFPARANPAMPISSISPSRSA